MGVGVRTKNGKGIEFSIPLHLDEPYLILVHMNQIFDTMRRSRDNQINITSVKLEADLFNEGCPSLVFVVEGEEDYLESINLENFDKMDLFLNQDMEESNNSFKSISERIQNGEARKVALEIRKNSPLKKSTSTLIASRF